MATFQVKDMADVYATFRPKYPEDVKTEIYNYAISNNKFQPDVAIDLACGSGQSTVMWAEEFQQVIGFDISHAQLFHAPDDIDNVRFGIGSAECVDMDDGTVDLVTIAQAMHWIDPDKAYAEAKRILRPGGVFATYAYGNPSLNKPKAHQIVMEEFYKGKLYIGGYWEEGRRHIDNRYTDFQLPFDDFKRIDTVYMEAHWSVDHFIGYLSSWSAYRTFIKQNPKSKALHEIRKSLRKMYAKDESIVVTWPIFILLGRKS